MEQHRSMENMRIGMLLFGGFALAFAVATAVIGNNLADLTVAFSVGNAETMHEQIDRGDDRFAFYRFFGEWAWDWRACAALDWLMLIARFGKRSVIGSGIYESPTPSRRILPTQPIVGHSIA